MQGVYRGLLFSTATSFNTETTKFDGLSSEMGTATEDIMNLQLERKWNCRYNQSTGNCFCKNLLELEHRIHQQILKCKGKKDDTEVKLQNKINQFKTKNDKLKEGYEKAIIIKALRESAARRDETGWETEDRRLKLLEINITNCWKL